MKLVLKLLDRLVFLVDVINTFRNTVAAQGWDYMRREGRDSALRVGLQRVMCALKGTANNNYHSKPPRASASTSFVVFTYFAPFARVSKRDVSAPLAPDGSF